MTSPVPVDARKVAIRKLFTDLEEMRSVAAEDLADGEQDKGFYSDEALEGLLSNLLGGLLLRIGTARRECGLDPRGVLMNLRTFMDDMLK